VDGWWVWFLLEVCVEPSSGWRRWLVYLRGIITVAFELRSQWAPNVGIK
jgi:hypothetical protein